MKNALFLAALAVGSLSLAAPAAAQMQHAAPASGYRAEFLNELKQREDKYVGLAEAFPAELYTWRPAEGVRSVSEVLLHVAAANYNLASRLGATPPAGFTARGYETATTDKARIVQELRQSFEHMRQAVVHSPDQPEVSVPLFGGATTTHRGFLHFLTGHFGEHLGQLIAYARMNDVSPPWSEAG